MGRKRLNPEEKKVTFHLSIKKRVIDQLRKEAEEQGEVPSTIIEDLIKKYLKNAND